MWRTRILRNIALSLALANLLILIGKDNWLELYRVPVHYLDMVVTFVSVFMVFEYVDWINRYLKRQLLLTGNLTKRIVHQLLLGVVVPALLAIAFTFIMWEFIWKKGLIAGNYFKYEFLPQLLMIIVTNLVFVVYELYEKATSKNTAVTLMAQKGRKTVPVSPDSVSTIQLKNGLVYLMLMEGEPLMLSNNLDALEKLLPAQEFFRANRQVILNRRACESFKSASNGKIEVELLTGTSPVIVSQKRAASFRSWMHS